MELEVIFWIAIFIFIIRLNVYLADKRGRNVWTWGILGAIFGILSTLVLLIMGETQEYKDESIRRALSNK